MQNEKIAGFSDPCINESKEIKSKLITFVIFGGAGDLSRRKLIPTLFKMYMDDILPERFSVVSFGHPEFTREQYMDFLKKSLQDFYDDSYKISDFNKFARNFHHISADFSDDTKYMKLNTLLDDIPAGSKQNDREVIFIFAVSPVFYIKIVEKLSINKITKKFETKVFIEKPFGRDRKNAQELNDVLLNVFTEDQIYRTDHYLGKETIQNIIFFRFANSIFEPIWNRNFIDHVQITVAESIGIEHRGFFYEQAGVVRDVIQNHMMQLVALVAMEPPVGFGADLIRDEKVKVFNTIRQMDEEYLLQNSVRGQYGSGLINDKIVKGYREEDRVSPDSNISTYLALKLYIDNWRWADVPFYVRSGKSLAKKTTEIYVQFIQPPLKLFGDVCQDIKPNGLIFSIQPDEQISLELSVKYPGIGNSPYVVSMDFNYEKSFNIKTYPPYARLLMDCIRGDLTLFARQDGVLAMWSLVDPVIDWFDSNPARDFPNYKAGTWGPQKANLMLENDNRKWRLS